MSIGCLETLVVALNVSLSITRFHARVFKADARFLSLSLSIPMIVEGLYHPHPDKRCWEKA